jgi:hypothetical protein
MRTTRFAGLIKRGWLAFKTGIGSFGKHHKLAEAHLPARRNKSTHSDGPIPKTTQDTLGKWAENPDGLPPGLPGSAEIRRLADVLAYQYPLDSVHPLIQAKDYTACHELAGFHEAITTLRDIADNVDAVNEEATKAAQAASQ